MGLGLELEVLKSDAVCGFGNITLDGHVLPQTLVDDVSSGQGTVALEHGKTIDASWSFHCVNVNGIPNSQLLKFLISAIDGKSVKDVGFSALFRQIDTPEILNIETDLTIPDEILGNPNPEALEPLHHTHERPEYNVDEDLAELDYLFWQMRELKHLIHEKKRTIAHHGHKHFEHNEEELAECDSLKCIARTVAQQAKHAAHHLYNKMGGDREQHHSEEHKKHHPKGHKKPHFPGQHDCHGKNCTRSPDHHKGNHTHPHPHRPFLPICRFPPPPHHHGKRPPPPPGPPGHHEHGPDGPSHDGHHMPTPPDFDGHREDGPPHHDGHHMPPPPDFDGHREHRPDFDGPPGHGHHDHEDEAFHGRPDFDGPPSEHHGHEDGPNSRPDLDGPSPKHHESHDGPPEFDHPPHHQPHDSPHHDGPTHDGPHHEDSHQGPPLDDQEHMRHDGPPGPPGPHHDGHPPPPFALQVAKYTAIGFLLAFFILAIRRRACTPARRADRQARREERHRRRAYRRVAHKHIITRILARISGDGSEDEYDDYEEKREALLADAEDGMSTTMTEEALQTRSAEEEPVVSTAEPVVIATVAETRPMSNFDMAMLGGEDLPAYEDDESDEGSFIADGFGYTPGSSNYSPSQSGNVSDILGPDSKS